MSLVEAQWLDQENSVATPVRGGEKGVLRREWLGRPNASRLNCALSQTAYKIDHIMSQSLIT